MFAQYSAIKIKGTTSAKKMNANGRVMSYTYTTCSWKILKSYNLNLVKLQYLQVLVVFSHVYSHVCHFELISVLFTSTCLNFFPALIHWSFTIKPLIHWSFGISEWCNTSSNKKKIIQQLKRKITKNYG